MRKHGHLRAAAPGRRDVRGGGDPDADDEGFVNPRALAEAIVRRARDPRPQVGDGIDHDGTVH